MTELEKLKAELSDKGVEVEDLAVIMIGTDQLIGEVQGEPDSLVAQPIFLKNPKRYMRIQKVSSNGGQVSVEFFVGGLDSIGEDDSIIEVKGVAGYHLNDLGPASQLTFFRILKGYFETQIFNRAQAAGLALPQGLGGLGGKG